MALLLKDVLDGSGSVVPQDVGLEGAADLRPPQHRRHLRRHQGLRPRPGPHARGGAPEDSLSLMKKELRTGKVFIDWSQNDEHKISPSVASALAAASIGSIMLPSVRATLIISASAASTAALSRAARRARRVSHCWTSTSWLTRRISSGWSRWRCGR